MMQKAWAERVEALRTRSGDGVLLGLTLWAPGGAPPTRACPVYTLTLWATGENFVGSTANEVLTTAERVLETRGQ